MLSTEITPVEAWKELFGNWPNGLDRTGAIVTAFGETIPFKNFLVSAGLLIVERPQPDTVGARKVIVPFEGISGLKLTNPAPLPAFQAMGFEPPV